jgi:hypothetical protein
LVSIEGVDSICKGSSTTLLASGAATYNWSNNMNTASNLVNPQVNTTYTVTGYQNSCYSNSAVTVKVYQALNTPVVTNVLDTLFSSYSSGNQWYYYYSAIAGANSDQYLPLQTGIYQVQVTDTAGCKSEFSIPSSITLGLAQNDSELKDSYIIYPNPSQGIIYVSSETVHFNVDVEVLTTTGYLVHKQEIIECSFERPNTINLSHLSKGIYLIRFKTDAGVYEHKISIE